MISKTYSKKNILICAYCVDKNDVSEAQMAYEWITRLSKFANLWVVTAGSRLHSTTGLEDYNNIKLITLKTKLNFKWWDVFDRFVHPGYVEFYFKARKAAKQVLREYNIDLCHHLTPQSLRYPSPLLQVDVPLVIGPFHGGLLPPLVMKELRGKEEWLFWLRRMDDLRIRLDPMLKKLYKKANRIIISAPYVKQRISPEYHNKCTVIPGIGVNPLYIPTVERTVPRDEMRMIYVAKLVPSKGLELLILALAKLKDNSIKLTVYGKGRQEKFYRRLAASLAVSDNIKWEGFVPYTEVIKAYADADVFVFPSLKEPAGLALIEAMSSGLPVLCVDAGGPGYAVLGECGIKVPLAGKEQMVNNLAKGIAKLRDNAQLRVAMGRNAQERVRKRFTWDVVVNEMLEVYDEVISMA